MSWLDLIGLGAPFVWFGMVAAISLLEAPIRFRSPGVTLAVGLSIGRRVFRALNVVESVLVGLAAVGFLALRPAAGSWVLLAAAAVILGAQVMAIRPRLDTRARAIIAGAAVQGSREHLVYVALEGAKVIVVLVLALSTLKSQLP